MAVNGSWIYINQPSDCKSRNEAYPCPNNYGPYNDGLLMTMPSGKGLIVTSWSGWGFPDSFVWKGQKGWVNGRSIFSAVSPTYVAGAYCVYDNDNNKIMFCAPEEYAMNVGPSDPSTCQSQWTFPPTPSPTPPPTNASSSKKGSPNGLLIGVVVATFFVLLCLAASYFLATKRPALQQTKSRTAPVGSVNPMIPPPSAEL